jgi:hypothetical protein
MTNEEIRRLLKFQEKTKAAFAKAHAEGRTLETSYDSKGKAHIRLGKQPKRTKPACGALCRTGEPCKAKPVEGSKRCRMHGGLSTGAKTPEGRAAIAESNRRRAKHNPEHLRIGQIVCEEIHRRQLAGLPLLPLPPLEELEALHTAAPAELKSQLNKS